MKPPRRRLRAREYRFLLAISFAAIVPIGTAAGRARAQVPPIVDVRVPSEAAGGGSIAVRITYPHPSRGPRYDFGAPVVVFVPGALSVGSLNGGESYAREGFVALTFLFPGGTQGSFHSDGTYDYRGLNCIGAVRDVLKFGGGLLPDDLGRTIDAILPVAPLVRHVALIGSSNGGPISMATLGLYGAELDFVAVYVGWENPTNGQTVAVELGGKGSDCDPTTDGDGNGIPTDDGKNPYITNYTDSVIGIDWGRLRYDAAYLTTISDPAGLHPPLVEPGALFLDGNGNGNIDTVPGNPTCLDLDGNGYINTGEDVILRPFLSWDTGVPLFEHSLPATTEAWTRGVTGPTWPPDYADPAQCDAFWSLRESGRFYDRIAASRPDLHCMLVFAAADHVQADDRHPHLQQAYDDLRARGIWCRLNCDASYYRLLVPSPAAPPVDNDANIAAAWPAMKTWAEPYPLSSTVGTVAGLDEMMDRVFTNDWSPDLDDVVTDAAEPAPGVAAALSRRLVLRVVPNPATPASQVHWEMPAAAGTLHWRLFDVAGRLRTALDERGAGTGLGATARGALDLQRLLDRCNGCAPGVYWLRLDAGKRNASARILRVAR
jgi:hypothetical protein